MAHSVSTSATPIGLTTVDPAKTARSISVDQARELLCRAVSECGYTLDALAASMEKDRSYIHKVLQGDKPTSLEFIVALPDDVEARFEQLRAESFGLIVVAPASADSAAQHLVAGLLGLLRPASLPARAEQMAKADLSIEPPTKKVAAR